MSSAMLSVPSTSWYRATSTELLVQSYQYRATSTELLVQSYWLELLVRATGRCDERYAERREHQLVQSYYYRATSCICRALCGASRTPAGTELLEKSC
jgi:hypothetical protein